MASIYKRAARKKLRIQTDRGLLSVEKLWDLTIPQLDKLAVALEAEVAQSKTKSFIKPSRPVNYTTKLKFEIVIDILETKVNEDNAARVKRENDAHNNKIFELMEQNNENKLRSLGNDELAKHLRG